jgi:hypothetical protein
MKSSKINLLTRIFALLSVLIIYIKYINPRYKKSLEVFRSYLSEKSIELIAINIPILQNLLKTLKNPLNESSSILNENIILIKLLEYYLMANNNKDISQISESTNKINIMDFIMKNLFLYENVYDIISKSYTNFQEKLYWNFGEIVCSVYTPIFPAVVKKTILRHIEYLPNNESLIYHLIQYYYSCKDYRKAKILINKILLKNESKSALLFEILLFSLIMMVSILSYEEEIGEALDMAIYNLERIKEFRQNSSDNSSNEKTKFKNETDTILIKSYFILGFCYSKVADGSNNYVEKNHFSNLALSCFREAKSIVENINSQSSQGESNYFDYYIARQYFDMKKFQEVDDILNTIQGTGNSKVINNPNFINLKILTNIALLKYDKAALICDLILKNTEDYIKFSGVFVIKNYLAILKQIIKKEEDNSAFMNQICEDTQKIFEFFDMEIKNYEGFINQIKITKKIKTCVCEKTEDIHSSELKIQNSNSFDDVQLELIEIVKFSNFSPFYYELLENRDVKPSHKIYTHEKNNLEFLRLEAFKNFYSLLDFMNEYKLDKNKIFENQLKKLFSVGNLSSISISHDETNYLCIVSE